METYRATWVRAAGRDQQEQMVRHLLWGRPAFPVPGGLDYLGDLGSQGIPECLRGLPRGTRATTYGLAPSGVGGEEAVEARPFGCGAAYRLMGWEADRRQLELCTADKRTSYRVGGGIPALPILGVCRMAPDDRSVAGILGPSPNAGPMRTDVTSAGHR